MNRGIFVRLSVFLLNQKLEIFLIISLFPPYASSGIQSSLLCFHVPVLFHVPAGIAGGGIEPPFRAKESRELPILYPASM